MAFPVKLDIVIPEDHRVELTLPNELPSGPAKMIVLPVTSHEDSHQDDIDLVQETQVEKAVESLADLFAGHTGLIDSGTQESLSENGGERLTDHLEAKRRTGHL